MSTITTRSESTTMPNIPSDSSAVISSSNAVADMGALRIAFNKLMVTMRNKQQEYAQQNQQQSLKFLQQSYDKEKESIKSGQSATLAGSITSGFMGLLGGVGGAMKIKGALKANDRASKLSKIDKQVRGGISEKEAYENVMDKKQRAALEKIEGKKEAWDKEWSDELFNDKGEVLANPLEKLRVSSASGSRWSMSGDALSVIHPLGEPGGKLAGMNDNAAAQKQKVEADYAKTVHQVEEREIHLAEDRARDMSQKMREAARDFNELYSKISSAVRW